MDNKPIEIVFMGTPDFAVPSLEALLDRGYRVVLVVTQPDRPRGRGKKLEPPPVKVVAFTRGLEIDQPESVSGPGFVDMLKLISPDLIVVTAYGHLISKEIIDIPPMGCINVHASLLPKYRGAAPVNWAIIRGETITGITTIMIDEGMDTGDILLVREIPILDDETAGELLDRLSITGGELLVETIEGLMDGSVTPVPQEHKEMTLAPLFTKEDGRIDWGRRPDEIKNQVRGMSPWPGAFTTINGEKLKVFRVEVTGSDEGGLPGEVSGVVDEGIVVSAGGGPVLITELQAPGKKRMRASDFLRGKKIEVGTVLGMEGKE